VIPGVVLWGNFSRPATGLLFTTFSRISIFCEYISIFLSSSGIGVIKMSSSEGRIHAKGARLFVGGLPVFVPGAAATLRIVEGACGVKGGRYHLSLMGGP
jgi:hypothetical protein